MKQFTTIIIVFGILLLTSIAVAQTFKELETVQPNVYKMINLSPDSKCMYAYQGRKCK